MPPTISRGANGNGPERREWDAIGIPTQNPTGDGRTDRLGSQPLTGVDTGALSLEYVRVSECGAAGSSREFDVGSWIAGFGRQISG